MPSLWKGDKNTFSSQELKHKYYVYAIKVEEYLEPIYIGKGSGSRARNHKLQAGNKALAKVLNKYESYFIEILASSNDEDVIFQLEKSFISKFGKKVDNSGTLLNFSDGGKNTAEGYFKYAENRETKRISVTETRGKPFYVQGFIFPSKRFASRQLGRDRNHINYLMKIGCAFQIDENYMLNELKYFTYLKESQEKYQLSVNKSKKQVTTNRPVIVNGTWYSSTTEAARENGVSQGAITNRIARGNQKNTYYADGLYG